MAEEPDTSRAAAAALVLLAEDDRDTRDLYQEYLRLGGFRTEQAHNGNQAFDKAVNLRPDVIVTDLALPGLDGFELSNQLKRHATTSNIPIIAVTGWGFTDVVQRARKAGIESVLLKPCPPEHLVAEVRRALESRRVASSDTR